MCIERVGGLSVLAFMLIKTFPTSQYLTEGRGKENNWLMKGKVKRERDRGKKGERVTMKGKGKGLRAFDVELVWLR